MRLGLKLATAIGLAAALAGCGNAPGQGAILGQAAAAVSQIMNRGAGAAGSDPVAAALAATDQPLILFFVEKRGARAPMTKIATNGAYETWSTKDRRTLTLRNGFLTASRGIGDDLMSTEDAAVERLVLARQEGQARRIQRFINGAGTGYEIVADCTVTRGESRDYALGEINTRTFEMVENCVAPEGKFENSYQLDGSGRVLSARQWMSPSNGYVVVSKLRR